MEPARGESCPSGQRRGHATPGGRIGFHPRIKNSSISLQLQQPGGRKRRSPASMPPRMVWKPQPNWVIADWLRLMEPARGESCFSGQHRGPAVPGEDRVLSPHQKSFHISTTNSNNLGSKTGIPGAILPHTAWKPQPHWLLIGWGSWSQRAARVAAPAKAEVAPSTGRLRSHSRIRHPFISLQFHQTGNQDGDPTGRYRPTQRGNPNSGLSLIHI